MSFVYTLRSMLTDKRLPVFVMPGKNLRLCEFNGSDLKCLFYVPLVVTFMCKVFVCGPDKYFLYILISEHSRFVDVTRLPHIDSLEENVFWDKIRNPSDEVFENVCTFCSHSFELISSGLNTSYCQTGRLQWLFNTTSNRVANKPKACFKLGHQLLRKQRPVCFSPLILFHSQPELSRSFPSKPLLSVRHLVKPVSQKCCLAVIHHHHQSFIAPALSSFIKFIRPVFRQADLPRVYAYKH